MKNKNNPNENFEHSVLSFWLIVFGICLCLLLGTFVKCNGQTPDDVAAYCDRIGIKHVDIVVAQSIEETGWYKCTDCSLDHNNLFGFRWKGAYLKFESWEESCDYYLRWQNKWYKDQDYYEFLTCLWKHKDGTCVPYANNKNYIVNIRNIDI